MANLSSLRPDLMLAKLVAAANKLPYLSSTTGMSLTDLTAAGRTLIGGADAAAQRSSLGVGVSQLTTAVTTSGSVISHTDIAAGWSNIYIAISGVSMAGTDSMDFGFSTNNGSSYTYFSSTQSMTSGQTASGWAEIVNVGGGTVLTRITTTVSGTATSFATVHTGIAAIDAVAIRTAGSTFDAGAWYVLASR